MTNEEKNKNFQWVRDLLENKNLVAEAYHCLNYHLNMSEENLVLRLIGRDSDYTRHTYASTFLGDENEILSFLLNIMRNEVFADELIEKLVSKNSSLVVEVDLEDDVLIPTLPDISFKKIKFLGRGKKDGVKPSEDNPYGVKYRKEGVDRIVFVFGRDITASDDRCLFIKSIYPA